MPGIECVHGTFTGDNADESVTIGFRAGVIIAANNDGDVAIWIHGMTADYAVELNATGPAVGYTTDGFTVTDTGFTMGVGEVNANGKTVWWAAFRRNDNA